LWSRRSWRTVNGAAERGPRAAYSIHVVSLVLERYGFDPAPAAVRRRRALATAAALGLFFAARASWRTPVLRFASPVADSLAFLVALGLPWPALALAQPALRRWHRVANFAALAAGPHLLAVRPWVYF
jgi:hypothetical protein